MRLPTTTPRTPHRGPVELGSTVHVRDAEGDGIYTLVTTAEADPTVGLISNRRIAAQERRQQREEMREQRRRPRSMRRHQASR